ncbi:formate dehydrogenase accessory sulfurtransferase FdhD [Acuticoccus sp. M5D2P5]|uniref:formate dehydrogenase accessory sulfurtransferase FdhD n=1 Tax=Acuticoccus kalidii TaxID=2910977 RepID=UPI001F2FFE1B|nr:formate dehydrogenase accessory sulfurtransferase FdhD [Acuticoccus kalidii]MCF3932418.1 formate dehydrogenase accessory sulfurtransferase FdhD [Acuticoccus kalidii]
MAKDHREDTFEEIFSDGRAPAARTRGVPLETPVALEFNGISYAVMMASPSALEDFVTGFAIAERLLPPKGTFDDIAIHENEFGIIARANLPAEAAAPVFERARRRVAESSCGLCGIENLEIVNRALPPIPSPLSLSRSVIFAARAALSDHQTLGRATGAVHAAALCRPDGTIALVREDVGRHNAFDKAIGARARCGLEGPLFALLSARCSYELVEKAVTAEIGALVTISAPTTLALDRAKAAKLPLYVLARADSVLRVV